MTETTKPELSEFATRLLNRLKAGEFERNKVAFGWKEAVDELVKAGIIEIECHNGPYYFVKIIKEV